MMLEEDKAAEAKAAAKLADTSGALPDEQKPGKWFSNPQASVQQLTSSVPAVQPASVKARKKASAAPGAQAAVAPEAAVSEFDAW